MKWMNLLSVGVIFAALVCGQTLSPEVKAAVEAKAQALKAWGTDPKIVAAVKEYNTNTPAEAKAMTNDKWKGLSVLDPFARSFTKNELGVYLKAKKDEAISECFVSGADGGKVAFLSKPSSWTHQGKEKHTVPMAGRIYYGPVELDESSGAQQVQVGIPVMDGGKPIGSMVVGLNLSKLK